MAYGQNVVKAQYIAGNGIVQMYIVSKLMKLLSLQVLQAWFTTLKKGNGESH